MASLWNSGTALSEQALAAMTGAAWFEAIRQLAAAPVRLGAGAFVAVGLYAGGLVALLRLVTPSADSGANARA